VFLVEPAEFGEVTALHFYEKKSFNDRSINSSLRPTETACRWPAIDGGFTPFRPGIDIESYEEEGPTMRRLDQFLVIESSGGVD
jgi:hypothetical protein